MGRRPSCYSDEKSARSMNDASPPSGRKLMPVLIRLIIRRPPTLSAFFIVTWIVTNIVPGGEAFSPNNCLGSDYRTTRSSSSSMPFVVPHRWQRRRQRTSTGRKYRRDGHGGTRDDDSSSTWRWGSGWWTRPSPAGHGTNPECTKQKRRLRQTIPWPHRGRSCVVGGGDGKRVSRHGERPLRAGEEQCEDPSAGNFGRRSYWEESYSDAYRNRSAVTEDDGEGQRSAAETTEGRKGGAKKKPAAAGSSFAWYCTWEELEPFWRELVPLGTSKNDDDGDNAPRPPPPPPSILIPGVGNDPVLRDMYDAGYTDLSAFDYAPSSVDCCRAMLGEERLSSGGVRLDVADARDLSDVYEDGIFDAVLDKGTLDAVFLIGGDDKRAAYQQVRMAVSELRRVLRPGGVAVSITGVSGATEAIGEAFAESSVGGGWTKVRDTREGVYITEEDGYASINIDATFLAWRRDPE